MGQVEQTERRYSIHLEPGDFEGSMGNLRWLAVQYDLAQDRRIARLRLKKSGQSAALFTIKFLYGRLQSTDVQNVGVVPLADRLVPLTDQAVSILDKHHIFMLSGQGPSLEPISTEVNVALDSAFCNLYHTDSPLTVWDLCPDGDPERPGLHLVAIKRQGITFLMENEKPEPWAIGWITDHEYSDLVH